MAQVVPTEEEPAGTVAAPAAVVAIGTAGTSKETLATDATRASECSPMPQTESAIFTDGGTAASGLPSMQGSLSPPETHQAPLLSSTLVHGEATSTATSEKNGHDEGVSSREVVGEKPAGEVVTAESSADNNDGTSEGRVVPNRPSQEPSSSTNEQPHPGESTLDLESSDDDEEEEIEIQNNTPGILAGRRGTCRFPMVGKEKRNVGGKEKVEIPQAMFMGHPVGSPSADFLERQQHRDNDVKVRKEEIADKLITILQHNPVISGGAPLPDIDVLFPVEGPDPENGDILL